MVTARNAKDFEALLRLWPSLISIHRDTGLPYGSIRFWIKSNWIPEYAWDQIIASAAKRGIRYLTWQRMQTYRIDQTAIRRARVAHRRRTVRAAQQEKSADVEPIFRFHDAVE